jgi:2,3-dihydroxy-2,3-dihydro-p-cumate dehydrogenase
VKHQGRVAVVTGSGRGLGLEIARRMLEDGAAVMITDVVADNLPKALAALGGERENLAAHAADLGEQAGAASLAAAALSRWGKVDILVNNAGGGIIRPFLSHTAETLVETIKRNLWTCIWCCQAFLPGMVERQYGRIVNIGADSVRNGLDSHAAYNAAKGGVHGITSGLAREFAKQGITVNTVAPPGILTPEIREMLNPDSEVYQKHAIKNINDLVYMIPMGRFAEMEEVASFVSYLASEEARFVTGQVLSVNGGSTML